MTDPAHKTNSVSDFDDLIAPRHNDRQDTGDTIATIVAGTMICIIMLASGVITAACIITSLIGGW